MTQAELAEKLNVSDKTVSKWEKGISVPDSEMLIRLSKELDTTVGELLGETIAPESTSEIQLLAARLEKFNLTSIAALTTTDELDIGTLGEKKVALFALIPDHDVSFNFLVSIF